MRHRKRTAKLGRTGQHRNAMLANLVCSLIKHKRVATTLAKAKAARSVAEQILTLGKAGTIHARRLAAARLRHQARTLHRSKTEREAWRKGEDVVRILFEELAPLFKERNGGYTRIVKLGQRQGDAAQWAILEWVDFIALAARAPARRNCEVITWLFKKIRVARIAFHDGITESMNSATSSASPVSGPWWRELTGYHWFVFLITAFGWMFDCFDQQIFTNSRSITMQDLMPQADTLTQVKFGTWATSIFILGWATGGLIFGTIGDKWGRAKTMALTILVYALFTGLSGFAKSWSTFALFRFLTGAGVGGEFAVGAALLAEVMPDRARPHALGSLQALSAIGNILAAVSLGIVVPGDKLGWGWRGLYYIGALPALIAVFVFSRLKEPERWVTAKAAATRAHATDQFGRISDLFTNPRWRRHTLVGLGLAIAGQIGLWGVGFYTPELIDSAIPTIEKQTRPKMEAILSASSVDAHAAAVFALAEKEKRKYSNFLSRIARP